MAVQRQRAVPAMAVANMIISFANAAEHHIFKAILKLYEPWEVWKFAHLTRH